MTARIGVAIMAALLLLYIVATGQRTWLLLASGDPVGVGMGIALAVLPTLAIWVLGRELWFGYRAASLGKQLEHESGLPKDTVSTLPSGRVIREDADAIFASYRDAVRADAQNWRDWYRLGLAYDASGDRRRARAAIRQAIRLHPGKGNTRAKS